MPPGARDLLKIFGKLGVWRTLFERNAFNHIAEIHEPSNPLLSMPLSFVRPVTVTRQNPDSRNSLCCAKES